MGETVRGYKVFDENWKCRDKQYTCPGMFEEEGILELCGHGMHFCKKAVDCFEYKVFDPKNKVAEVVAHGEVVEGDDKCCTNKLEIVREIPWPEVLELCNEGFGNSGRRNSGDRNSGDWNSGDWNSGNRNSGNRNSGDRNSGDRNSGDWNSGDWNAISGSSGCFNTENSTITMFNKPTDWSLRDWWDCDARIYLNEIPRNVVEWISSSDMTDEEKLEYPEHETTGGYLKILDESENAQIWWDGAEQYKKDEILDLPNFDAEIFKKCTGITV